MATFARDVTISSELIHSSTTTDEETGRVCFMGASDLDEPGFGKGQQATVLVAGPGLESSGFVTDGLQDPELGSVRNAGLVAGDLVEAICGTRPEGL